MKKPKVIDNNKMGHFSKKCPDIIVLFLVFCLFIMGCESGKVTNSNSKTSLFANASKGEKAAGDIFSSGDKLPALGTLLEPIKAKIGEEIHLEIVAKNDEGQIKMPDLGFYLREKGDSHLIVKEHIRTEKKEGKVPVKSLVDHWILAAFDKGIHTIPPMRVSFVQGSLETVLYTNTMEVEILSVLPEVQGATAEIKAIGFPMSFKGQLRKTAILSIFAAFLAILAILYWIFRAHRKEEDSTKVYVSPHEEAFDALALLERRGLVEKGSARLLYFGLSEILRRYLGRIYGFGALEATTDEIMDIMHKKSNIEIFQILEGAFGQYDMVKFAKFEPDLKERRVAISTAKNLVDMIHNERKKGEEE